MQKFSLFLLILIYISGNIALAQTKDSTLQEVKGILLDNSTKEPLPYANIYVLHQNRGTISNENGWFLLNIEGLKKTDTVQIKYVGYTPLLLPLAALDSSSTIYLKEEIFNLDEILVFAKTPDARSIVKRVIANMDSNYAATYRKKQIFIRERYTSDLNHIALDYKKSNIPDLDKEMISNLQKNIPRHNTSFSDFLGNFYFSNNEDDSVKLKVEPVKTVALKDKNLAEFTEIMNIFDAKLKDTKEGEYWKVKTGIFSQKVDLEGDSSANTKDTLKDNERRLKYFRDRMQNHFKFSTLKNKDDWEFLYKTGKYNYTLASGTRVNGEEVYIINFEPDGSGLYRGRMYISTNSFALIRADFEYAPEKTGTDFNLFGVGYTENLFSGSIYFEKDGNHYRLKYFSRKVGAVVSFNRNVALLKKKERFLFDKKLNEIKTGINITVSSVQLFECLVLNDQPVTKKTFDDFKQKQKMKIIYVDKFDDNLWKGYSIIEPTRQMRDYKKQKRD